MNASNSELASDSKLEGDGYNGNGELEPNVEGVLRLGSCLEDKTSSLKGLFHWLMEEYEVF